MPRSLFTIAAALVCVAAAVYFGWSGNEGSLEAVRPTAPGASSRAGAAAPELVAVPGGRGAADRDSVRAPITAPLAADAPRTTYTGRVFERATGAAIQGAKIRLVAGAFELGAESDAEGRFTLEWPDGVGAALAVEHARYTDCHDPHVDLSRPAAIGLERSGSLVGSVVQTGTRRPQEADVLLWGFGRDPYRSVPMREIRADKLGRFAFADLTPGIYAVGCVTSGLPMAYETGVQVVAGGEARVSLELTLGAGLSGRVQVQGGADPVVGAEIRVRPISQGSGTRGMEERVAALVTRRAISGADGEFELDGLPTGLVEIRAVTPWGASLERNVVVSPERGELERIVFPPPAHLSIRVVDSAGAGVAGARVSIGVEQEVRRARWPLSSSVPERSPDLTSTVRTSISGSDGRVDMGAVPSRTKLIVIAYPPAQLGSEAVGSRLVRLPPGETPVNRVLQMRSATAVSGTVTDTAGAPLAGVLVSPRARLLSIWSSLPPVHSGFDGDFRLPQVPHGPVQLGFELEGYHTRPLNLVIDDENEPVLAVLDRGDDLSGYVLDAGGYAVPAARVRASRFLNGQKEPSRTVRADEYGRFRFPDLDEGSWSLRAYATGWIHPERAVLTVFVPAAEVVTLTMEPRPMLARARVSGEVVVEGTSEAVPGIVFDQIRGGSLRLIGSRFRISGMKPGRCRVIVSAPGFEPIAFDEVLLTPGSDHQLGRVELRTLSQVRLNVVDPSGEMVRNAMAWLDPVTAERGGAKRAGAPKALRIPLKFKNGRYVAREVSRHIWALRVRHRNYAETVRLIEVSGGIERLKVELAPRAPRKPSRRRGR